MTRSLVFVFNHLWQSTAVGLLAWVTCATILRANSARLRFAVWMTASLKFLVPLALLVDVGQWLGPGTPLAPSAAQRVFDLVETGRPVMAPVPFMAPAAGPQAADPWWISAATVLLIMWAIGAAVVAGRWLLQWRAVRCLTREAQPAGSFRGVPLLQSTEMRARHVEPGVVGFRRQSILLPNGLDRELAPEHLEAVLVHEWEHVKRHDNVWAALHAAVQATFWFHPLVWMIGRRLTDEREIACDEGALRVVTPEHYAAGILQICKLYWRASQQQTAGIAGADLRSRIAWILGHTERRPAAWWQRSVLGAAAIVLLVAPPCIGWLTAQAVSPQDNSFVGLATSADRQFEVATIKENNSGSDAWNLGPPARGNITIRNLALASIVAQSFRTDRTMVIGEPAWIGSTRYDIVAKGPDATATNPQVWEMMRRLLLDRFHLQYHVEQRQTPIFALRVVSGGSKLTAGENGRCAEAIKAGAACGDVRMQPLGAEMSNMPIGALISAIGRRAGRPIVDRTNLTGRYDARVFWVPAGMTLDQLDLSDVPAEYRPPDLSLRDALEQTLGLKLESDRAPLPFLVIDSISRPDPN
jgi:uncharacterized protein (TIGR03435 family)